MTGPRQRLLDAIADTATERLPSEYLGRVGAHRSPRSPAPRPRRLAWLLTVGGVAGLLVALLRTIETALVVDVLPLCDAGSGPVCEPAPGGPWSPVVPLLGVVGFAALTAVGAITAAGVELSRRGGIGLQVAVTVGVAAAHGLLVRSLVVADAPCWYCLAVCLVTVPLCCYATAHGHARGWLTPPAALRRGADVMVEHRRLVVVAWSVVLVTAAVLAVPGAEGAVEDGAAGAVGALALVTAATLLGAWTATRYASRIGLWLSMASAMMMVSALTDILPHVWHDAEESGTPLWVPGLALVVGFLVVTFFTRGRCGHGHDGPAGEPAAFGGVGAAAALTLHRVVEGATLALTPSVPVVGALLVHSASEGLALAALFASSRRSLLPWLTIAVAGPAVGVVVATVSPLPEAVVPVLLALVAGVLLRTAVVGLAMAAGKRRTGELRNGHIAVAVVAAAALGALALLGH